MEVIVAQKCGFCFGVEHAINLARQMLSEGKNVYCLGSLIHNKQVVDRLVDAGLHVVDNLDEVPMDRKQESEAQAPETSPESQAGSVDEHFPTVLIRSHGCDPELIEAIKAREFELADATCVLVKRVQKLVRQLHQQGYHVAVVGDPEHPEVQGVLGYAPDIFVLASEKDLERLPKFGRLAIVSQTTHSIKDFERIVALAQKCYFQEVKVHNTICHETTRRQASAIELCSQVQVMFVLGSHNSANTSELAQICRQQNVDTYHLQNFSEFKPQYVEGKEIAGVTAGASTPDWIIQEFVDELEKI